MTQNPTKRGESLLPETYKGLLKEIKNRVRSSQLKAAVAVNREMINLYWEIGSRVFEKQKNEGWGAKTIEKLAKDLKSSFPDMKGFSLRNLQFMVQFSREYPDFGIVKQAVSQIPWGHNIIIMQKLDNQEERLWYVHETIKNGWSRTVLTTWIEKHLYKRQGKAINNFKQTLPSLQSDLAEQTLKDPYCFDFLTLRDGFEEKELEKGLLVHIQKFLLELGAEFVNVHAPNLSPRSTRRERRKREEFPIEPDLRRYSLESIVKGVSNDLF